MELVNTVPKINPEDFEEMVNSNMKVSGQCQHWISYCAVVKHIYLVW